MPIRTKRWNDAIEKSDDGYRLLICRYRPRGVRKEDEPWDAWCQALAPSEELHALAYGKSGARLICARGGAAATSHRAQPIAFDDYERRFLEEMTRQRYWIVGFAKRIRDGETITLLCSSACEDPNRCHRTIVKRLIEEAAFPPEKAEEAVQSTRIIRRRT